MGELKMRKRREEGMVAIWGALTFLFLVGAVAFAADTSGFFQSARVDQTTADLACLAGVQELPGSSNNALAVASENVKANFPRIASASPVLTANQATLTVGGNVVVINTNWNSDPKKMRVHVTSSEPRTFSRIWGSSNIPVVQQAVCSTTQGTIGGGTLPFAAGTLGYQGGLQDCGQKVINPGNCGQIRVPHEGINGNNNILEENIASGLDRLLAPWLGAPGAGYETCDNVGAGDTCNEFDADPGTGGKVGLGFQNRLANTAGADCTFFFNGRNLNCDTPAQILGSAPTPIMSQFPSGPPSWWEPSLYGAWNSANTTNHYWYNGVIAKCDSPRIGAVPIASSNLNWDIGDPFSGWNGSSDDLKVVGMYDIIIVKPNQGSDFQGSSGNNLKNATSYIMWYGPSAQCPDGSPVGALNGVFGAGPKEIKLVAS
jgi:Flp pilus assembly protein TadG